MTFLLETPVSLLLGPAVDVSRSVAQSLSAPRHPRGPVCMAGFGAAVKEKKKKKKKAPVVQLDPGITSVLEDLAGGEQSLLQYLNPRLFEDPATMQGVSARLKAGEVVVLRDAFRPEFAEMVHAELSCKHVAWELNEAYFPDGYAHRHHNVYDKGSWSQRLNSTLAVFADPASQRYMEELTGRDCSGETIGAPSWYKEGDHSLPHTDWVGQRTVAYVWHLSKSWKAEWGGGLYWTQNDHDAATYPASFNTLVLFSVSTRSAHFVTTVSPKHKGKRLTFNGWWQSAWVPQADEQLEEVMSSAEKRRTVTHTQLQAITDLLNSRFTNIPAEKRERLQGLRAELMSEFFPHGSRSGIEA